MSMKLVMNQLEEIRIQLRKLEKGNSKICSLNEDDDEDDEDCREEFDSCEEVFELTEFMEEWLDRDAIISVIEDLKENHSYDFKVKGSTSSLIEQLDEDDAVDCEELKNAIEENVDIDG